MVELTDELRGKVALVTGSTRNIGRATAIELARAGASVIINGVQAESLCEEVAEYIRSEGGQAMPFIADVKDPTAVGNMIEAAIQELGGIDIIVHNAAARGIVPINELEFETFKNVIDISILGFFHLVKAALPSMISRRNGCIVGVGGMASTKGAPGRAHVMTAKMGQNAFIRGLAYDLAQYQIRANQVVVGSFDTERVGNPSVSAKSPTANVPIPLGRKGVPQDLANLIRFVVGPGASYITGETIHCNGGAYMNL